MNYNNTGLPINILVYNSLIMHIKSNIEKIKIYFYKVPIKKKLIEKNKF